MKLTRLVVSLSLLLELIGHEEHPDHVHYEPAFPRDPGTVAEGMPPTAAPPEFLVELRTGEPPAQLGDPTRGTLLATFGINRAFIVGVPGQTVTATAENSGTAGHLRVRDASTGAVRALWRVGVGGKVDFQNNVVVAGGTAVLTSAA
jgi:hypothetical protein